MKRRRFLQRGALGGALLLVLGGGGLFMWPGDRSVTSPRALESLSPDAFAVLVAVAARVLKGTGADPLVIAGRVDAALALGSPQAGPDVERALLLLDNGLASAFLRGAPTPFTLLDAAAQHAALLSWRDSRLVLLRGAYHALRKLCLAAHYAAPECFGEVSYPGPSILKPAPPSIEARRPLAVLDDRGDSLPAGGGP